MEDKYSTTYYPGVEEAKVLFRNSGLLLPPIPEQLASTPGQK